jgi:hypothetical protein
MQSAPKNTWVPFTPATATDEIDPIPICNVPVSRTLTTAAHTFSCFAASTRAYANRHMRAAASRSTQHSQGSNAPQNGLWRSRTAKVNCRSCERSAQKIAVSNLFRTFAYGLAVRNTGLSGDGTSSAGRSAVRY